MPATSKASTNRNCSSSIGKPLPSASRTAGAEPSDALFIDASVQAAKGTLGKVSPAGLMSMPASISTHACPVASTALTRMYSV